MIGEVKEVELKGKTYEITKRGCSAAMAIQGLFALIIAKARLDLGSDMPVEKMLKLASVAMTDDVVARVKEKVVQCVSAPVITSESFEEMDFSVPLDLFAEIYSFHCEEPDDKKKEQSQSGTKTQK
jgi:hypothetical protein